MLSLPRAQVQVLVGEIRAYKLCVQDERKKHCDGFPLSVPFVFTASCELDHASLCSKVSVSVIAPAS